MLRVPIGRGMIDPFLVRCGPRRRGASATRAAIARLAVIGNGEGACGG